MRLIAELSFRLLRGRGLSKLGLTGWISLSGLVLGVACLVVSMGVVSGFEKTLQRSVSDITGDLQVLKVQGERQEGEDLLEKVKAEEPHFVASTKVIWVESVAARQGQITGALVEGLDPEQMQKVLTLKSRVTEGTLSLADQDGKPTAMIGKGLAAKFGLKVGDDLRVVVPLISELDPNAFRRNVGLFRVSAILDLGKYEFDERLIVASLASVQKLADVGERYSGLLIKLTDSDLARESAERLRIILGPGFRVRDWRDLNENIFEAIKIERVVIFFVILIIVLAAAFNVSSSLYISVVQRYPEIGIFKAMGLNPRQLIVLFSLQGVLLGLAGCLAGTALGLFLGFLFSMAQNVFGLLPGSVYKLDHIDLVYRPLDLGVIFLVTLSICALATLSPARRGARLTAVEGLRHE